MVQAIQQRAFRFTERRVTGMTDIALLLARVDSDAGTCATSRIRAYYQLWAHGGKSVFGHTTQISQALGFVKPPTPRYSVVLPTRIQVK